MVKVQVKKATAVAKKPANKKTANRTKPSPSRNAPKKPAPKKAAGKSSSRTAKPAARKAVNAKLGKGAKPARVAVKAVAKKPAKAVAKVTKSAKPAKRPAKAALKPGKGPKIVAVKPAARPKVAAPKAPAKAAAVKSASPRAGSKKGVAASQPVGRASSARTVAATSTAPKTRPGMPPARPGAVPAVTSRPVVDDKKRARRPRPRVQSNGAPVAAWLNAGEKPRPSSFIPAPARAEAPSLVAAPPASSDRLIRSEDLTDLAVRTVPVRIDVEYSGGRSDVRVNPEEVVLRVGEGIEWDFRYLGGADVSVDEIVIEFEKPSPFVEALFHSKKPGPARPHRQLSGPAQSPASGQRFRYVVRAMNAFKTEIATARPWISIVA
jgi:hypothetical protein